MTRALVLRAPAINCDRETALACRLGGFETDLVHINQLLKDPDSLLDYQFLVIPGGFSYGDDLGAGTLLAKNLMLTLGKQLQRFVDEGRPILGICNGFQVLVRAGLLPGFGTQATLTDNAGQYECRWVSMNVQPSACIFTRGIDRILEIPVAHGEGQFVLKGEVSSLFERGQVPLVYTNSTIYASGAMQGRHQVGYPDNPNGSIANIAGICNERGTVFGMMPHPERFVQQLQHPQRRSLADGEGDGMLIFKNAFVYASTLGKEGGVSQAHFTGVSIPAADAGSEPAVVKTEEVASSYASSGVSIAAAEQAKSLMRKAVRDAQGPEVLAGMGAFAGVFDAQRIKKLRQPALVASTDGVGTKTLIAIKANRFEQIGHDLVNHSVNDLLTQGAQPLFFMDYIAMGKLDPVQAATIVRSVAEACQEVGCALLGGETAEMPDVYRPEAFDLAGTIVGMIDQEDLIDGTSIRAGDILLGLPSSGLHTNGYSLARRIFAPYELETVFPELGEPLVDVLLRPHRCYLQEINQLRSYLADRGRFIKGMAHITGGGFEGNIARILPPGTRAVIETNAWVVPPIFSLLARLGNLEKEELYRTFNMGIGMVIALAPKSAIEARSLRPELVPVGRITEGVGVTLS